MHKAYEVNFDGLVGLSHHYGGLSYGNVASLLNQQRPSNPQAAALQGLEKMKLLLDLGLKQAVLPPHERPYLPLLRQLGFRGTDAEVILQASKDCPEIFFSCSSAAAMWAANAATLCPSVDALDRKMHITPANLADKFHRSLEYQTTQKALRLIFAEPSLFTHHNAPPAGVFFSDEGAASHNRFCQDHGSEGVHLYVYGKSTFGKQSLAPARYPPRQALEASQAIARNHQVEHALFAQQSPEAIDAGVFHNDVISLANQTVFLYHEQSFVDTEKVLDQIQKLFYQVTEDCLLPIKITHEQLPLKTAVSSYLFNSQLVSLPDSSMALICPKECENDSSVKTLVDAIVADSHNPIQQVHYLDLHQSMANGGGPACLRLRVVLTENELKHTHQEIFLTHGNYPLLKAWIKNHYRDRLVPEDLKDPLFYEETKKALAELTQILNLGNFYDFQNR